MKNLTLFLACICIFPAVHAQTIQCDPGAVVLNGAVLTVEPSDDDSAAMQCALEEAVRLGVRQIRLTAGDFTLRSPVVIENFEGRIEGRSQSETRLTHLEQNAFTFFRGAPSLRRMTIEAAAIEGTGPISVAFFGSRDNCNQRVIFAEVDRVDLIWSAPQASQQGIAMGITNSPGCTVSQALGSFTLNRSSVTNYDVGVVVSTDDAARVVIRTNQFSAVEACAIANDANADFTFAGNRCEFGFSGVGINHSDSSVPRNRLRVFENQFIYAARKEQGPPVCVSALDTVGSVRLSASITDNSCVLNRSIGAPGLGVSLVGAEAPSVVNNVFRGSRLNGMFLDSTTGAYVNGNRFQYSLFEFDAGISNASSGTVIQSQGVEILDAGVGTLLLPQ